MDADEKWDLENKHFMILRKRMSSRALLKSTPFAVRLEKEAAGRVVGSAGKVEEL